MNSNASLNWDSMRIAASAFAGLLLALVAGCGGEVAPPIVPASGVVTLNGKPLPNAKVRFIPQVDQGSGYIAVGETDSEGRYEVKCQGQAGACACETIVTVSEGDLPEDLLGESAQRKLAVYLKSLKNRPIPRGYGSPVSTPFQITVTEGEEQYDFVLQR